jgi:MFS family permease
MRDPTHGDGPGAADNASPWLVLLAITLISTLAFIDRSVFAILVEPVKRDLSLSDTQVSLLLGPAFTICSILFATPIGWLSDKSSRRVVLAICVLVWSGGMLITAFARDFNQLLLGRATIGLGEAGLSPLAFAILGGVMPADRHSLSTSFLVSSSHFGAAIALSVGGILLANVSHWAASLGILVGLKPWQLVTLCVGAPGAFGVFLALLIPTSPRPAKPTAALASEPGLWEYVLANRRRLALLFGGFGGSIVALTTCAAWTPAFISRAFHWSPSVFGPTLGSVSLFCSIALMFGGAFQDWLSRRSTRDVYVRSYFWLFLAGSPAIGLAYLSPSGVTFVAAYVVIQVAVLSALLFLIPTLRLMTPERYLGRVFGAYFSFAALLSSFGPVVVGMLTDQFFHDPAKLGVAISWVNWAAIAVTLACLGAYLRLPAKGRAPAKSAALLDDHPTVLSTDYW